MDDGLLHFLMKSTVLSNSTRGMLGLLVGSFLFLGSCQSKNPSESTASTEEHSAPSSNRASARFQLANGEEFGLQTEDKKWTVLHFFQIFRNEGIAMLGQHLLDENLAPDRDFESIEDGVGIIKEHLVK